MTLNDLADLLQTGRIRAVAPVGDDPDFIACLWFWSDGVGHDPPVADRLVKLQQGDVVGHFCGVGTWPVMFVIGVWQDAANPA